MWEDGVLVGGVLGHVADESGGGVRREEKGGRVSFGDHEDEQKFMVVITLGIRQMPVFS